MAVCRGKRRLKKSAKRPSKKQSENLSEQSLMDWSLKNQQRMRAAVCTVYMDDEAGQVKNTIVYRSDADFYKNIPQIKKDFSKAPFRRRTQYYGEISQSISDESAKG